MKTKIHELEKFREQRHLFADRVEAGETLAVMLKAEYDQIDDGMILAIPSGGVPVGLKMSEILILPFDLLIVRKLQIPGNPEAGFGAMSLAGTVLLNENLLAQLQLNRAQIEAEKKRVELEFEKRNKMLRAGRPFPDLSGKRVILADDGPASGFTMLAAIDMVKKAKARETVVVVPTAPQRSIDHIISEVDNLFCANIRIATIFAVAEAYRNWYDLSEKEVIDLVHKKTKQPCLREKKVSSHRKNESSLIKTEILSVRLPGELMETISGFCASNDIEVEKFAIDALSEKLGRWKG